jgi:hypothetical protein
VINGASLEAHFEPPSATVQMVYSQQDEFAGSARQLFDVMQGRNARIGGLRSPTCVPVPGCKPLISCHSSSRGTTGISGLDQICQCDGP